MANFVGFLSWTSFFAAAWLTALGRNLVWAMALFLAIVLLSTIFHIELPPKAQ